MAGLLLSELWPEDLDSERKAHSILWGRPSGEPHLSGVHRDLYTNIEIQMHTYMCVHIYIYINTYIYRYIYVYIYIYITCTYQSRRHVSPSLL